MGSVLRAYHRELCALGAPVTWEEVQLAFAVDSVLRQGMWKLDLLCQELDGPAKGKAAARDNSVEIFLQGVRDGHLPALARIFRDLGVTLERDVVALAEC